MEETVIDSLTQFGLSGSRSPINTGVWIGNNKISAIGLAASRWITMHGCAININCDLESFKHIVPCGISDSDYGITSVRTELQKQSTQTLLEENLASSRFTLSSKPLLIDELNVESFRELYVRSFSKVFDVELVEAMDPEADELNLKEAVSTFPADSFGSAPIPLRGSWPQ